MAEPKPEDGGREEAGGLSVVYVAASAADANLLRNLLAEAGIRAVVMNSALEGGGGVDLVGWSTAARVAVAAKDAQAAREIALKFDRTCSTPRPRTPDEIAAEEADSAMPVVRPRCPKCGARRVARCPICRSEGRNFRPADPDYLDSLGVADDATPLPDCGCESGSCHKDETAGQAGGQAEPADASPGASRRLVLLCPTCDEPFEPRYARRCADCGHDFGEGFETGVEPAEHFNYRAAALIAVVLAVLAGLFLYFAWLVPGR